MTGWHRRILCKESKNGEMLVCISEAEAPAEGCKSSWGQRALFSIPAGTFLVSEKHVP